MTPTPARLFLALLALLLLGLLADRYVDPNPTWAVPSPPKPAPTASLEVPKATAAVVAGAAPIVHHHQKSPTARPSAPRAPRGLTTDATNT